LKCKGLLRAFKWNEAVEKKGTKARIHFGIIAQELAEAFRSENLNPDDYGMFCYDEWEDQYEKSYKLAKAGNAYGVRYEELLVFIIASL
jgi:hypothetical protein